MRSVIGLKPVAPRVSQVVGCLSGDSAAGSRGNPCERRHRPTARVHKTVRSAVVAFWGKDENLPCMARASGAGRTTARRFPRPRYSPNYGALLSARRRKMGK